MAGGEEFLCGELLDLFFDFDLLDEEFEEEFAQATNEITTTGEFRCPECEMICKSKSGLTRHMNSKHKKDESQNEPIYTIDETVLKELLQETIEILSKDLCYPEKLRAKISSYNETETSCSLLLCDVQTLYKALSKKGDADKYYKNYYTNIVSRASYFFPGLENPISALLAKRLGDKILAQFKKPKFGPVAKPMEISQRELDSLQYLGGYVVKKILRKTKNSKKYRSKESQGIIAALECMVTTDFHEQRLIKATSRGGLTALHSHAQNIFKIVEEHFRIEISVENLHKIDTLKITQNLIKNIDITSMYNNILINTSVKMNEETQQNLLEKLISLYLRVRSFSTARDITDKYRVEQKKLKAKGLRKAMKKSAECEK